MKANEHQLYVTKATGDTLYIMKADRHKPNIIMTANANRHALDIKKTKSHGTQAIVS